MPKRRQVLTKTVRPQWYRRYAHVLPPGEQVLVQPIKEIIEEEDMLKAMETPPPVRDRAEELARKLALEKATRIKTVLDLLEGNMKNVKEKLKSLKPMTGVLEYMTEDGPETPGHGTRRRRIRHYDKQHFSLPATSKWHLIRNNKLIRQKIKKIAEEMRVAKIHNRWKKAIRIVRAIIRFRSVMADIARTTGDVFKHFNEVMEKERLKNLKEGGLYFDMAGFRTSAVTKELDIQSIYTLGIVERKRSEEDVVQTAKNLRFLRSFAAFPAHFQIIMIKIGWILDVPKDKVIIREGQIAHNFYFLMSGRAVSVKLRGSPDISDHGAFEVLEIYERDALFGEEGVFGRGHREYSVTCIEDCQLLSVNIDDYNRLCLTGQNVNENPEHIRLISQLEFMRYFPMKKLIDEADGNIILFYFPPGKVVTRKTSQSNHIYVIKSGQCRVMASVTRRAAHGTKTRTMKVIVPPKQDDEEDSEGSTPLYIESWDRNFVNHNPSLARVMSHTMTVQLTDKNKEIMAHLPRRGTGAALAAKEETNRGSLASLSQNSRNSRLSSLNNSALVPKIARFSRNNVTSNATACKEATNTPTRTRVATEPLPCIPRRTSSSARTLTANASRSGPRRNASATRSGPGAKSLNTSGKAWSHTGSPSAKSLTTSGKAWPHTGSPSAKSLTTSGKAWPHTGSASAKSLTNSGKAWPHTGSPSARAALGGGSRILSAEENVSANAQTRRGSSSSSMVSSGRRSTLGPLGVPQMAFVDDERGSQSSFTTRLKMMDNLAKEWATETIASCFRPGEMGTNLLKAASIEKMVCVPGRSNYAKETKWIHLRDLRESDVIGMGDLDIGDENEHVACDVAVVSEGSEVILIDKDYFLANSSPKMRAHLRESSFIMPDETSILIELKRQSYWKKFRAECGREMAARRHGAK